MSFLLDTNVVSELRKRDRCHAEVVRWITDVDDEDLFVSVMTLGEIRRGVELLRRRDPDGARPLDRWLRDVERDYSTRTLPIDREIANLWGRLCLDRPLAPVDGLLAATCIRHGLTLVTRNARDFQRAGIDVLDPFRA